MSILTVMQSYDVKEEGRVDKTREGAMDNFTNTKTFFCWNGGMEKKRKEKKKNPEAEFGGLEGLQMQPAETL